MSTEEYLIKLVEIDTPEARKIANSLVTCWENDHLAPEEYGRLVVQAYNRADRFLAKNP